MDGQGLLDAAFMALGAAAATFLVYGGWIALREAARRREPRNADATGQRTRVPEESKTALPVVLALAGALAYGPVDAAELDDALSAYERGKYQQAGALLHSAASSGDPRAQELLGMMYAFGPRLYSGMAMDLRAAAHWLDLAARNGRPVARFTYCALARRDSTMPLRSWHCFDRGESLSTAAP